MPSLEEPRVVAETDADAVEQVIETLQTGRPVIVPTDTVYGLAVRAGDLDALDQVFALKDRPADRSVAVLVSDVAQAETVAEFGAGERHLAQRFWPGALTIVAAAARDANVTTAHDGTIGLRVPDRDLLRQVAARVGPLATTSANRSGQPTPPDARAAAAALTAAVALIVDGGPCVGAPSSVVRCGRGFLEVLRVGMIRPEELAAVAGLELATDGP